MDGEEKEKKIYNRDQKKEEEEEEELQESRSRMPTYLVVKEPFYIGNMDERN